MICSVGSFLGTTQTSRWPGGDAALIGVRGVATSPGCCLRRTGRRARPTGRPGRPRRSRRELGDASAPTLPGHPDARCAAMSPGSGRLFRVTSGCGAKEETECLRRRSSHSARQFTHGRVAWVAVGRGDPRRFLLTTTATGIRKNQPAVDPPPPRFWRIFLAVVLGQKSSRFGAGWTDSCAASCTNRATLGSKRPRNRSQSRPNTTGAHIRQVSVGRATERTHRADRPEPAQRQMCEAPPPQATGPRRPRARARAAGPGRRTD